MIEKRVTVKGLKLLFNENFLIRIIKERGQSLLGTSPLATTSDFLSFIEAAIILAHDEYCTDSKVANELQEDSITEFVMNARIYEVNTILEAYQKFILRNADIVESTLIDHFTKTEYSEGLALTIIGAAKMFQQQIDEYQQLQKKVK